MMPQEAAISSLTAAARRDMTAPALPDGLHASIDCGALMPPALKICQILLIT